MNGHKKETRIKVRVFIGAKPLVVSSPMPTLPALYLWQLASLLRLSPVTLLIESSS